MIHQEIHPWGLYIRKNFPGDDATGNTPQGMTHQEIRPGIGEIWYRKKVSEPVSEKFGTGKSLGTGIGKIWYRN